MLEFQELADSWREIESLRSDLESRLREAEHFLQNMLRRPADLETKVSQNQLDQAQVSVPLEVVCRCNASCHSGKCWYSIFLYHYFVYC